MDSSGKGTCGVIIQDVFENLIAMATRLAMDDRCKIFAVLILVCQGQAEELRIGVFSL